MHDLNPQDYSHFMEEERGTERLGDLLKVTWVVSGRDGNSAPICLMPKFRLFTPDLHHLGLSVAPALFCVSGFCGVISFFSFLSLPPLLCSKGDHQQPASSKDVVITCQ